MRRQMALGVPSRMLLSGQTSSHRVYRVPSDFLWHRRQATENIENKERHTVNLTDLSHPLALNVNNAPCLFDSFTPSESLKHMLGPSRQYHVFLTCALSIAFTKPSDLLSFSLKRRFDTLS